MAPALEGLSLAATLERRPAKMARPILPTGRGVPAALPGSGSKWYAEEAQPLPDPSVPPLWYFATGTLVNATQAVKGTFPPPQQADALLCTLQAGAALVRWRDNGRPGPYFPLVQGQALLHAESMGTVEWGAIVPNTACTWITPAAPHPVRSALVCHHLLQTVPPLAPRHVLTREVWRALLNQPRDWMTARGA